MSSHPTTDQWLKFPDAKPARWQSCLIAYEGDAGSEVCLSTLMWNGAYFTIGFGDEIYQGNVTHWMPLPLPPKERR